MTGDEKLPFWIKPTAPVYAVYWSEKWKLELYRKYTVIGVGQQYLTVRDFYDHTAPGRRFHRHDLTSARVMPAQEELIPDGPRLNQAKAAALLVSAHANITRRLREFTQNLTDRNALRMLAEAVEAAQVSTNFYAELQGDR